MIYNHWSQVLKMALTATWIQSNILNISFIEARENISHSVNVANFDEIEEFCWSICFMCPNNIDVPYKEILEHWWKASDNVCSGFNK